MIPKDGLDVKYFLAAFRRRLWYVVIPFFLIFTAAVVHCIKAPRIYRSSSLILIQPQEVPTDIVRPTVTTNVKYRLSSISDEIMSRSRLEEIIIKHDVYPGIRKSANTQDAIDIMRKNIDIDFKATGRRGNSVTSIEISFEGRYPVQVREVTAELAELFIDYNFRLRSEQAAGTSKFLERELTKMKDELRTWEDKVRLFKEKYAGLLPEQMDSNYRILTQLQQHLDSVNDTLQKTEDRKILLQAQLSKLDSLEGGTLTANGIGVEPTNLEGLRQQLQTLKSRYSDKHPDVVKLKARIAKLGSDLQTEASIKESGATDTSSDTNSAERLVQFQREDRFAELRLIEKEIDSLRKEKMETEKQIYKYRDRIEMGPKIEAMFVDLHRGYEQASANYKSLLQKKLQAELAENLERTQKGEQFRILDAANLPTHPYKPDIQKLLSMGLMLALGIGFGLAFLREYLDPAFWSRKELESVLELPVLVAIPKIQTDQERHWRMAKRAAAVCILLAMSSTLGYAMYLLWKKSPGFIPLPI
jgi:polysaccharide chain length determinant protein (PEP-CTERM system associated)